MLGIKAAWMRANPGTVKTLVLGSSHAFYGIKPEALPQPAYSLAAPSQTLRLDVWLLEHYLPAMPMLRRVMVSVSYFSLHNDISEGTEGWRLANYGTHYGYPLPGPLDGWEIVKLNGYHNLRRLYQGYVKGEYDKLEPQGNGLHPMVSRSAEAWQALASQAAGWHKKQNETYVASNRAALERMALICHDKGIKLQLVSLPARPEYWRLLDPEPWRQTQTLCRDLAARYPGTVSYQDLSHTLMPDSAWYDADHLSGSARLHIEN